MENENRERSEWSTPGPVMTKCHGGALGRSPHCRPSWRRRLVVGALVIGVSTATFTVPALAAPSNAVTSSVVGLAEGSVGNDVKTVQQALMAAGIRVAGGADGRFGPVTRSAVSAFQAREGLPSSGNVDEATAKALGLVAPASAAPSLDTSTPLAVGARGDVVKRLQQALLDSGVPVTGGADGVFGPATMQAVSNFQRWNGLPVTGTADAATLRSLAAATGRATPAPVATPPAAAGTGADASSLEGLAVGSTGARVKTLQERLLATGLVVRGGADGVFGPATKAAVEAFQRVNGLDQNGKVTAKVAELLRRVTPGGQQPAPVATPAPPSNPFVGLKVGARGSGVEQLQRALLAAGLTVRGGADGVFGPATKSALVVFQRMNGLEQTGVLSADGARILALGSTTPPAETSTDLVAAGYARFGESSERVRSLQEQLLSWNVEVVGGADGSFGPNTRAALEKFQRTRNLRVTGTVTAETATKLKLPPAEPTPVVSPKSVKLVHFPVQGRCYFGDTWGAPRGGGRRHVGVDIIGDEGLLLYAVVDGVINKRFFDLPGALSGNGLRLTAPDGTYYTYLHLLDVAPGIELGTKVKAGDVIGFLGNTGSSATAHLHFEIHPGGGGAINPYPYVKAIDDCKNTKPKYQTSYLG